MAEWNNASGHPLLPMAETDPKQGHKVMLTQYVEPNGDCGRYRKADLSVGLIGNNHAGHCKGSARGIFMHELGHKLGLGHDFNPVSPSIMRVRLESYQRKSHCIDIESLNRLSGCTETKSP